VLLVLFNLLMHILPINPSKVLFGLSRIGYTPSSAICDIIDNAVSAKATKIYIDAIKIDESKSNSYKNNIKEYIIADNGNGMDSSEILAALELGTIQVYENNSLSKFGLGLKSATFSQGDELQVISSKNGKEYFKYCVNMKKVEKQGEYFAEQEDLTDDDKLHISNYLGNSNGTIIRIGKVRIDNHAAFKNTLIDLTKKLGVIYFYFIKEGLEIYIQDLDDKLVKPYDPLHIDEANTNGTLDENTWDGTTVNWIQDQKTVTLDAELDVDVQIEITQTPHPPSLQLPPHNINRNDTRKKYMIGAGDYGFFVYRNKRLISWAERFGIITQDQDLYSFKGRILIDDKADDSFNIDVKKSHITLSEEALQSLDDLSSIWKRKSKAAWLTASDKVKAHLGQNTEKESNEIVSESSETELLTGEEISDENFKKSLKEIGDSQKEKVKKHISETTDNQKPTDGDVEDYLKQGNAFSKNIFRVPTLPDNVLYAPFYDGKTNCVQINLAHRFAQLVYNNNSSNKDLLIIIDVLLHQLALSENYSIATLKKKGIDENKLIEIFEEHRLNASEYLAKLCRKKSDDLPPI